MKTTFPLIIVLCFINLFQDQSNKSKTYNLLFGICATYSKSDGIYVCDFDSQTEDFNLNSEVAGEDNSFYLAISRNEENVYSVNGDRNGGVSTFAFNPISGELTFLNRVSSGEDRPCYVAVDDKNKYAFAGNYGSGSLSANSLKEDCSFCTVIQVIQHEGSSIDKRRQKEQHVHATILSPDNHYLLTTDLGTYKVSIYQFDDTKTYLPLALADPAYILVKAESDPRHITFIRIQNLFI
jgi:6-phosphogluconolactonase